MWTVTENDCSDTRVGERKVGSQIQQLYPKNYVVIFCDGANDVAKNNSKMAPRNIRNLIK
jgi:hypothetical protein